MNSQPRDDELVLVANDAAGAVFLFRAAGSVENVLVFLDDALRGANAVS